LLAKTHLKGTFAIKSATRYGIQKAGCSKNSR